jgi:NAD-dependent deacetylase
VSDAGDPLELLAGLIARSTHVVTLTGLRIGGSESLDPSGSRGEWAARASLEALLTNPQDFWEFYYPQAVEIAAREPRDAHFALGRMQGAGLIGPLVTHAVDRLHVRVPGAGEVVEVHGSVTSIQCARCDERYALGEAPRLRGDDGVPRCSTPDCDGYPLRPGGTLWGEPLVQNAVTRAWDLAGSADLFIVVDCDLRTIPMSFLPSVPLSRGIPLVVLGGSPTQYDRYAKVVDRQPTGPLLAALAELMCLP